MSRKIRGFKCIENGMLCLQVRHGRIRSGFVASRRHRMNVVPFEVFNVTPARRIAAAKTILNIVKVSQAKDGAFDFPLDVNREYGNFTNCLCEAGFIRKVDIADGGFPYRLTWKGLCYCDIIDEMDNLMKSGVLPDSIQGLTTRLRIPKHWTRSD